MATDKKATHEVVHPKLHMRVNDKMQRVPVGTPLVLSEAQATAFGDKVKPLKGKKTVDLTQGKAPNKMNVEELKAGLDKAGIPYTADDKKADLVKLLEGAAE